MGFSFEGPLFSLLPAVLRRLMKKVYAIALLCCLAIWQPTHSFWSWANHYSSRRIVRAIVSVMAVQFLMEGAIE